MTPTAKWLGKLFGNSCPLIGVVHLPPLPGTPRSTLSMQAITRQALRDASRYWQGGVDAVLVENFGDAPFYKNRVPAETVAAMATVACKLREDAGKRPLGINVLRNDGLSALAVAAAADLDFIRVNILSGVAITDQGLIEGEADTILRYRQGLCKNVRIFADVHVKHATPMRQDPLWVQVEELVERALADAVLVTGACTGDEPNLELLAEVKAAARSAPVLVASGASLTNLGRLQPEADGFIVGTALKSGGRVDGEVSLQRTRSFAAALRKLTQGGGKKGQR